MTNPSPSQNNTFVRRSAELSLSPGASPSTFSYAPCWTILGKTTKSSLGRSINTPGPGTYRITQSQGSPRYSVGKARRSSLENLTVTPGPGSYNPQLLGFKGNNVFGKAERAGIEYKTQNPGPGVYEIPSIIVEGPRYTFRPKIQSKEPFDVPGPGKYEPNHTTVLDKAPVWGTKTSARAGLTSPAKMTPGPGTYIKGSTLTGPKWGFGSAKRGRHANSLSPGPGTYEIRASIGSAPSYVQLKN